MSQSARASRGSIRLSLLRPRRAGGWRDLHSEDMAAHSNAARDRANAAVACLVRPGDLHRACRREDSAPRVSQRATAKDGAGAALEDIVTTELERGEHSVEA